MAEYSSDTRLVVAAIDFGTTYSGYTFSFRDKPLEVKTNQVWIAGSEKLLSLKTPTCVLLDPQKNFVAFGFEAENKYGDLADEDKHKDWYFFRRFKMVLYQNKELTIATEVEEIRGKRMDALTIFSHAIRYMVEHFRKSLDEQMIGITDTDIQYVLTVPAIWNDKAKQFMRKAAIKAGIPENQLLIALEPESASIWAQIVTDECGFKLSQIGTQYIVADIGGGTADITAHRKMEDGTLKELHRASGGPWGGTLVDKQYLVFLERILGHEVMDKFVKNQTADYIDLLREFETKKRTVSTDSSGKMVFRLPASLRDICESERQLSTKEVAEKSIYSSKVSVTGEKLRVEMDVVKSFFQPAINGLVLHMKNLLQSPELQNIKMILLVGGFGECSLLKSALVEAFGHMKLINPQDASLTVLKGAVRFGHMSTIISCRMSKYAYWIDTIKRFDESIHPLEKKVFKFGTTRCKDLMTQLVCVGEELSPGKEIVRKRNVMHGEQPNAVIKMYCSDTDEIRFTTDPGCNFLGKIKVQMPESKNREDKKHTIRIVFWDTEIKVFLKVDRTGEEVQAVFDCI